MANRTMGAAGRSSPQNGNSYVQYYEQGQSPEGDSSAIDSENDQFMDQNGSPATRAVKRKRPLTVS